MKKPNKNARPSPPNAMRVTRHERSAGVVLFRDTPAGRRFLLLNYGRHWDYPKGHVERGEDDPTAALRELKEETGITHVSLLPGFVHEIVYHFRCSRRNLVRKTVVFYLASTAIQDVVLSEEHVGYDWLPAEQALQRLTYPTARRVFNAALRFLAEPTAKPAPAEPPTLLSPPPSSPTPS